MKRLTAAAILAGFALVQSAHSTFAQYTLTIDENGNGLVNNQPLQHSVAPDPTGGIINSSVLIYFLPFDTQPGDVRLVEPGTPNDASSDLIRFYEPTPGANASLLIFYSDVESGAPPSDLADVGIPSSTTTFSVIENGPEGNNGAVWTPALPAPGVPLLGGPIAGTATYNIISDVPEPSSLSLFAGGAILIGVARRGIKNRRTLPARPIVRSE